MSSEDLPIYKRVLNRCRESLVADMDFDSMRDNIISNEVLTTTKLRDIKEEKYTSDKIRKLIEAIESAGPDAYKVFKNGLKETNQRHLYDELNKAESKLARESKEQNKRGQGSHQASGTPSGDRTQLVTNLARNDPDGQRAIQNLPDDFKLKATLDDGNNTQQAVSSSITSTVLENVQRSTLLQSSNAQSFPSSQRLRGKSQTSDITPRDVADGPTVVSPNTEDDTIGQSQSTQASNNSQRNSDEQPISFGNLTSYEDMHKTDRTESLTSSLKQEHYGGGTTSQQQPSQNNESGRRQGHPGTGEQATGVKDGQSSSSQQPGATTDPLPDPAFEPTPGSASRATAMPGTSHQHTTSESRDDDHDDAYLAEHFDACVIFEESDRNRAEEVRSFIENLNYKICLYDDSKHFDMFLPEGLPSVIIDHCVLQLIIISDNQGQHEDKNAIHFRNTVAMVLKNSAKIRPVLFLREEERFIPKSLANTKKIAWYNKDEDFFRRNLLDSLEQCKKLRLKKEEQKVKTKKNIDH